MGTTVEFRFPFGRYHATPWGRHPNEAAVEWPPSPWRIARALVATWLGRAPELLEQHVSDVLDVCARAPEYRLPRRGAGTTRHYLPEFKSRKERRTLAIDGWVAVDPAQPMVVHWDADLGADQRAVLSTLLTRLPYLGRADSLVDARLVGTDETIDMRAAGTEHWVPQDRAEGGGASVQLLAPVTPVTLDDLTVRTRDLHAQRRTTPPGTRVDTLVQVRATRPVVRTPARPRRTLPTAFRYAIVSPKRPPLSLGVAVADLARSAAQSHYGRLSGGGAHPALSGRQEDGPLRSDHRHAHWIVRGERRVDELVVWIPGADDEDGPVRIDDVVIDALVALRQLRRRGGGAKATSNDPFHLPLDLGLEYVGDIAGALRLAPATATSFVTATPFLTGRHRKRGQTIETLIEEAVRSHLFSRLPYADTAVRVEVQNRSWAGVRRYRLTERIGQARIGRHVRLVFDAPVPAPISIGDLSHFGAGLFLPEGVPDRP